MSDHQLTNRALARCLLLPTIFLTVALMGGVRIDAATRVFLFVPPALITLVLAALLLALFVRGQLIELGAWLAGTQRPLTNIAHALMLGTLFFASAQAFNAVLPEAGLLRWLFAFFFLWTLWQNQFSAFDARRLLRSLCALFGTAFVLRHVLLAGLYAPEGNWLRRLAGALFAGLTQGALVGTEAYAPATGYLAFFTLALYVCGLVLLAAIPADAAHEGQIAQAEARQLAAETQTKEAMNTE